MVQDGKRHLKCAAAVAAVVLAFAATWFALDRTERRPAWLIVEAPASAIVDRPLEIRVALKNSVEVTQIDCSLHHAGVGHRSWGYLASSGPARPAIGGGTYSFSFVVPEHEDMAFVFAIVYLSPTGKWEDATRAVSTQGIPVKSDDAGAVDIGPRKIPVHHYPAAAEAKSTMAERERPRGRPSVWVHPLLSVLLLGAGALSLAKARRTRPEEGTRAGSERTVWILFGLLLVVCAVIEMSGIVGHLAAWARRMAREQRLYEGRKAFQKAVTAAAAAASLGLFFLFIRATRRSGSHRFLWWAGIGLAAYLAVSFVSVLSFHAVDVARSMTWHGLSPVDGLRGAGALVALVATALAVRKKSGTRPV